MKKILQATIIQSFILHTQFCTHDYVLLTQRYMYNLHADATAIYVTHNVMWRSPEILREEILTAWCCLHTTFPSFPLSAQHTKYRERPLPSATHLAAQIPSYSLPHMVQVHLHCSQIDTHCVVRCNFMAQNRSYLLSLLLLSPGVLYALLFLLSTQRVNTCF